MRSVIERYPSWTNGLYFSCWSFRSVHAARPTCDHSFLLTKITRLAEYEHDTLFSYNPTLSSFAFTAMSAPKTKPAANGTKKSQVTTKDSAASVQSVPVKASISSSGKPDKAVYDAEQQRIKDEIDLLQGKLVRRVSRLCLFSVFNTKRCPDCCEGENLIRYKRRPRE